MTEPPTTEGPQRSTLVAVVLGGVIGIVSVLMVVGDLSLLEAGLILLPMVVMAAVASLGFLWAKRRGHLD
jgi:hypothetical protein